MIRRRQFLGSVAAFCAAGPLASQHSFAATRAAAPLNWDCTVIETISHRSDRRKPVVTGVDVDNTGKLMAVVGDDHYVGIYDFNADGFVTHLDRHTDWVRTAKFSPDATRLATAGNDRQLLLWDAGQLDAPTMTQRNPEAIIDIAYSGDGSKIATVGFEKWLRVFDIESGQELIKRPCACPDNHAVAFSADSQQIAAAGRCGTIRVWDVESGNQVAQYKAHRQRVRSLEFSVDGLLISGSDDQTIAIADPANTKGSRKLPRHAAKFYAVQLLPNGMIATGGSDNRIHLSRLSDGSSVGSLEGHTGTVSSLTLKGEQLVSGSYDTQVRIWTPTLHASTPVHSLEPRLGGSSGLNWQNKR